jgi:hypothetical protein
MRRFQTPAKTEQGTAISTERVQSSTNEEKNVLLHKVAQKIFEEATAASLGATFHVIISFHLKQKFGKDPYEVLIEDPKCFYNGLNEVLGAGAEAVINLVGTYITIKYDINCTAEEFVRLFTRNGKPQRSLSQIFADVVSQEENKLKAT